MKRRLNNEARLDFWVPALTIFAIGIASVFLCHDPLTRAGILGGTCWFIGFTCGRWEGWKRGRDGRNP